MAKAKRNVIVVADPDALAAEAARRVIAQIKATGERPAICLTGGSSPRRLYELLGGVDHKTQIPWERVHWFIGDDRFVRVDDPLSNMGMARRLFLDRCAPAANIHTIPTDSGDPARAAQRYESELRTFYGADILDVTRPLFGAVLMGIGPDGHTASVFPGSTALEETGRWVVGVEHANVEPFVSRVTLTLPVLASSREMLFLVSGADKHAVLSRVLAGEDLPAARAHSLGVTTWLVDAAADGRNR